MTSSIFTRIFQGHHTHTPQRHPTPANSQPYEEGHWGGTLQVIQIPMMLWMVVSGSPKRWDRWHSPSPNWQNIPLIYHLYIAFWEVICYLPPFMGTWNNHWCYGVVPKIDKIVYYPTGPLGVKTHQKQICSHDYFPTVHPGLANFCLPITIPKHSMYGISVYL